MHPSLIRSLPVRPTQYEGPTGIVGVLNDIASKEGFDSTSLWASVPHYVGQTPSPKAMLALVEMAVDLLGSPVDTKELETAAEVYEQQIDQLVNSDDDIANYVAELEENQDQPEPDPQILVDEAQRFLRDQNS